jgi:transcriptional regulator with XRE-family HTH domain
MALTNQIDTAPLIGKIREKGMSQQEFADKDGRSLTAVRKILNGETELTWNTIMKWSDILGVEVGSSEFLRLFFSTKS